MVDNMKLGSERRITQIIALLISNLGLFRILKTGFTCPFLYCHGCPFAAFGCPIGIFQHFLIEGKFPLFAIGSLGVYGTLLGRVFCGWVCPFGSLHDLLTHVRGSKGLKAKPVWYSKFVILFAVLGLAWLFLDTIFCKFCPSGSLFATVPALVPHPFFNRGFSPSGLFLHVHIFTLVITVVLALLISRFWCRYLCPMGGVAGAFNKVSIVNISLDEEQCKKCFACLEACGMGITKLEGIGRSTDCILCGRCVEACPEKALRFTIKSS